MWRHWPIVTLSESCLMPRLRQIDLRHPARVSYTRVYETSQSITHIICAILASPKVNSGLGNLIRMLFWQLSTGTSSNATFPQWPYPLLNLLNFLLPIRIKIYYFCPVSLGLFLYYNFISPLNQASGLYSFYHHQKVWHVCHCLGLGRENMICAVCLSIFILVYNYSLKPKLQ